MRNNVIIDRIIKIVEAATSSISLKDLSKMLGKKHDRGTANYVRGAFSAVKKGGNDFLCGKIATTFVDRNGKFPWKKK